LTRAQSSDKPTMIACKTQIGFGAPNKANSEKAHGSPLGADEIAATRKALGWTAAPFEVPADILDLWRNAGKRGASEHAAWKKKVAGLAADQRGEFERRIRGDLPDARLAAAVRLTKETLAAAPKDIATRSASEFALEALTAAVP